MSDGKTVKLEPNNERVNTEDRGETFATDTFGRVVASQSSDCNACLCVHQDNNINGKTNTQQL
jgi:hypothetical protein